MDAALTVAEDIVEPTFPRPFVLIEDLTLRLRARGQDLTLLHKVGFSLEKGSLLSLIGESGSGKTVAVRALMRLLPKEARLDGRVTIDGVDVLSLKPPELRAIRGPLVAMVFQEPATALDPAFTIGHQISETIRAHEKISWGQARKRALELMELVQIPSAAARLQAYPHELSGGIRQRAMIAVALSCRPKVLIADEPTTALDATIQTQILLLIRNLQRELGMTTILVTHDIGVASEVADRVAVMYAGRLVEIGPLSEVLRRPAHPYTQGLLRSSASATVRGERLQPIPGAPPDPAALPPGCSFGPRCSHLMDACKQSVPAMFPLSPTHASRCLLADGAALAARNL